MRARSVTLARAVWLLLLLPQFYVLLHALFWEARDLRTRLSPYAMYADGPFWFWALCTGIIGFFLAVMISLCDRPRGWARFPYVIFAAGALYFAWEVLSPLSYAHDAEEAVIYDRAYLFAVAVPLTLLGCFVPRCRRAIDPKPRQRPGQSGAQLG